MAELKVKVVKSKEITQQLNEAFEALEKNGLEPMWVTEKECLQVNKRETDSVYVVDPFEGDVFNHLLSKESRVYGPQCVLSCLLNQTPLPRVKRPIYNMAMNGLLISCTNLAKQLRESIHNKVRLMCGEVSGVFTRDITHLVTSEVGSKKYHVAASLNTAIMTPEWVEEVWKESKLRAVHAKDEQFSKYKCGVFKGYVITVSGLQERNKLAKLIEKEGGRYTGEMKINDCTHLVINEPKGQKYEFAKRWKIHIVHSSWLYDSLESACCKDENQYQLDGQVTSSTPTKTNPGRPPSLGDVSRIADMSAVVDETAVRHPSASSLADITSLPTMGESTMNAGNQSTATQDTSSLDNLNVTKIKGGFFLDGCKIYLSGFSGSKLEKLRKLVNKGGATRFDQVNESVSHFVMGNRVERDINTLVTNGYRPKIVSGNWLLECCLQKRHLPETDYECYNLPTAEPTSPIPAKRSKLSISRGTLNDTRTPPVQNVAPIKEQPSGLEMDDVMSQYLLPQDNNTTMEMEPVEQDVTNMDNDETQVDGHEDENEVTMSGLMFHGKTFRIQGFEQDILNEMTELIKEHGGQVLAPSSSRVGDYAVIPALGCEVKSSVGEVVTNIWLESCLENEAVLPVRNNELFSPFELKPNATPLQGCVLSVSGYSGRERDCLMNLAELMGAVCQEYFVRKANKGLQMSTHLVVNAPGGSKYAAAKKWKLPALHKKWLFECARTGERLKEGDFLIDDLYRDPNDTTAVQEPAGQTSADDKENGLKINSPAVCNHAVPIEIATAQETPKSAEPNEMNLEHQTVEKPVIEKTSKDVATPEPSKIFAKIKQASTGFKTPVALKANYNRVKDLKHENKTPVRTSPRSKAGIDTPGKFLKPDVQYKPSFDVEDFLSALDTPEGARTKKRGHARKSSLPLEELLGQQLAIAIKNTTLPDGEERRNVPTQITQDIPLSQPAGPLKGVVIAVSKKLSSKQSEYNNMAANLGADYRWTYDKSCTHFIFQGRANDTTKEFRLAREQGKCIVSPHWLTMCCEQEARVDESLFPHNFNPSMQLAVVTSKKDTPARSTRRSVRGKQEVVLQTSESTKRSPIKSRSSTSCKAEGSPMDVSTKGVQDQTSSASDTDNVIKTVRDEAFNSTSDSDEEMMQACVAAEEPEETGEASMDDLSKQLKSAIEATKAQKPAASRRKSRQRNANNAMNSSVEPSSSSRSRPSSRQRQRTTRSTGKPSPALVLNSEPSQSVQVTWDDPTGRLEQMKLAAALERANSPTQNSESLSPAPHNAHYSDVEEENAPNDDSDIIQFKDVNTLAPAVKSPEPRTPTPEAPSLAFPVIQTGVRVQSPQPVGMIESEHVTVNKPKPVFLFSGMSPQERDHYAAVVEELGGRVLDSMYYDSSCTHLVVGSPSRNEKFLACVATGAWVLHKSYFEACAQENRFVEEDQYEWGGPGTETLLMNLSTPASKLAQSAYRWRVKIEQDSPKNKGSSGAFQDWKVILCTSKNDSFKRLLEAGGAKVVSTRPPFNNLPLVTHAFLELAKIKLEVNLGSLLEAGIPCVKPEYLAAFLSDDPLPNPSDYYINEVKEMTSNNSEPNRRKRKPTGTTTPSKRSRRQ